MKDYLNEWIGVPTVIAVFGFIGGVLSLSVGGARTPLIALASVFSGLVCATAFTPAVRELWHYPDSFQNGIAFALGLGGYNVVKFISEKFTTKTFAEILARWASRGASRGSVDDTSADK